MSSNVTFLEPKSGVKQVLDLNDADDEAENISEWILKMKMKQMTICNTSKRTVPLS